MTIGSTSSMGMTCKVDFEKTLSCPYGHHSWMKMVCGYDMLHSVRTECRRSGKVWCTEPAKDFDPSALRHHPDFIGVAPDRIGEHAEHNLLARGHFAQL